MLKIGFMWPSERERSVAVGIKYTSDVVDVILVRQI